MKIVTRIAAVLFLFGLICNSVALTVKDDPRAETLQNVRYFAGMADGTRKVSATYCPSDQRPASYLNQPAAFRFGSFQT